MMSVVEARKRLTKQKIKKAENKIKREQEEEICELLRMVLKDSGVHCEYSTPHFDEEGKLWVWTVNEHEKLVPKNFEGYPVHWKYAHCGSDDIGYG